MDFERGSRRCCIGPVAVSSPRPSVDAGYRVEDKGKDWVQKTLGWSVDGGGAPEEACLRRDPEVVGCGVGKEGVAVDWQKLLPPKASWYSLAGGW
jgi:hypothetical protein